MNTEQREKLDKLRSKWNLECALAQKNKVSYILKRSRADYLRVFESETGLAEYQAEVIEDVTGVGNHKDVAVIERERIVEIVDEVFVNVPEDTVLGKLGMEIQEQIRGVFTAPKRGRGRKLAPMQETVEITYPLISDINLEHMQVDALELQSPSRGSSALRNKWAVFSASSLFVLGATITGVTSAQAYGVGNQYVEPIQVQKLVVSSTSAPSAGRTVGIYIPQLSYPFDPSTIGDGWGWRAKACGACSEFHQGIDFNPGYGAEIPAVMSGTVVVSEYSGSLGQHVYIDDGYGMVTIYGHMVGGSNLVNVGDRVERGQIIGQVGNTGTSTGAHLHLAIQWDGVLVNPLYVLDNFPVNPALVY